MLSGTPLVGQCYTDVTIIIIFPKILGGECGKKPGHIKPFDTLNTQEIRKELQTRQ